MVELNLLLTAVIVFFVTKLHTKNAKVKVLKNKIIELEYELVDERTLHSDTRKEILKLSNEIIDLQLRLNDIKKKSMWIKRYQ